MNTQWNKFSERQYLYLAFSVKGVAHNIIITLNNNEVNECITLLKIKSIKWITEKDCMYFFFAIFSLRLRSL